jgi:dTDP-4-amino-4,6-dideoxygalactose transaminase
MSAELALFGGPKVIAKPFVRYNPIGQEELEAVSLVMKSGRLSPFLGAWETNSEFGSFFGGRRVQEFEQVTRSRFKVEHAVTVNSATSGLIVAIGAAGIEPGDEVIVSPWTMCASATAILWWNAIPVFADIEDETFNLDPMSVQRNITPFTKAIVVPDIFGHPAQLDSILNIAEKHNLMVIEDCAQSPMALYKGRIAGTVGHIGVLSLNYHKHIHTGEGGICLTDDAILAEKMQLIRNHAEAVVKDKGVTDLTNMMGFNFRLGEMEAAIGIEQFKKLDVIIENRVEKAARLGAGLADIEGLRTPVIKEECTHVFYAFPLVLDIELLGCPRARICEALQAEGVPASQGYVNVHLLPIFQKKIAYGKSGFPWSSDVYKGNVQYDKGICPIAEGLHDSTVLGIGISSYEYSDDEIDLIIQAFHKVWKNMEQLR